MRLRQILSPRTLTLVLLGLSVVPVHGTASNTLSPELIKEDLYAAYFATAKTGWVVGTFGSVLHTTDQGKSWRRQPTRTQVPLFSVSFADARTGWAVGKAGTILRTTNGGQSWEQQAAPSEKHLFAVKALSPQVAWAVGDWGVIVATSDGGATWQDRSLSEDVILYGIDFADLQYGWIAGEVGNLFLTEDGGQTWTRQRTPTGKSLFGIHVAEPGHAWAVGLDGEIWQLADGAWLQRPSGVTTALYDVAVAGDHGWVVGDSGTALASTDGGDTWHAIDVPDDLKLFWMHTVSLTKNEGRPRGFIGGANGLLLWIRDEQITAK